MRVENERDIFYYNEAGELRREDGSTVIYPNGAKEWYLNGIRTAFFNPYVNSLSDEEGYYFE
jgi:hypothetical protein